MNKPYIIIFSTVSIDGRLAAKDFYSELSCKYDKIRQHILRSEVDAVLVGGNTVRKDNPSLKLKYVKGKDPVRVVVSKSFNLDINSKIFIIPPQTIVYTEKDNCILKDKLISRGIIVRIINNITICKIMNDLYENFAIRKIMIEGGGNTIWNAIKENCYDEIRVTISSRIFGNGINLANGEGFNGEESPSLQLVDAKICECNNEIHLIYKKFK